MLFDYSGLGKMRRFLFYVWCMVLFTISGCAKDTLSYKYDNQKEISAFEVVDIKEVPDELVNHEMGWSSLLITLESLQEQGIVQSLRYNKEHYYSITPLSDGSYLLLLFEVSAFEANGEEKEILYVVDNCLILAAADGGDADVELQDKMVTKDIFTYLLASDSAVIIK